MESPGPTASDHPAASKKSGYSLRIVLMGILLALLANLVLVAMVSPRQPAEWEDASEAMRLLNHAHVAHPGKSRLAEGAVGGMVNALGDPYTQFLAQNEATQWENRLHGESGLRPLVPSGAWLFDPAHGLGYVALGRFSDHSAAELEQAVAAMKTEAAASPAGALRGLVVDLRGNPGGYLTQATDMAGLFLPRHSLVVKVGGPSFPEKVLRTEREPVTQAPLVVLVDGASASASEVLAGALQEHGRAFIVGARSFGKGCVQNVTPLESLDGKLKMTVAYYFLPSGRCLHRNGRNEGALGWGVPPSPGGQVIPAPQEEKERQALLKAGKNPLGEAAMAPTPDLLREKGRDPALAAALAALLGKAEGGAWPRVGDDPSAVKNDPHWRTREEIRTLETRLRQLRQELTLPAAPK